MPTFSTTRGQARPTTLRLWPGVALSALVLLLRFGVPAAVPGFEGFRVAVIAGLFGALAIFAWWAFLSRAPRAERWGAITLILVALALTWKINHPSMRFMWCVYYGLPVVSLVLVVWAVAGRRSADGPRRASLVAAILLVCSPWPLIRMDGFTGDHRFELGWRFAETDEQRLLAEAGDMPAALASQVPEADAAGDWSGFRGEQRDGIVRGVRIASDWSASPPVELWRLPVGPGWSSFAVRAGRIYTQEQRGEDEVVTCYDAATGEAVWRHRDRARFYEPMGGVGPRATPTVGAERVYALGATGILNALDADDGTPVWARDVAVDIGIAVPTWGFSGSPLILDDLLIVAASGVLAAYDRVSGELRWRGPQGGASYSSPQRMALDGIDQVVLLSALGATSVAPTDGHLLWQHLWPGTSLVQPASIGDGGVLINAGEGKGLRRIDVAQGAAGWGVEEHWTSNRLKPNFSDFVVHRGHAFGFDGRMLACIDLERGERRWKGGRYGHGQLVLLSDQEVLLVLSEEGELALVGATPEGFTELARMPAIEGKTWNHPALVGDLLLVRNAQEMAAFRLPREGR